MRSKKLSLLVEWKLTAKAALNGEILKKMLDKSSEFLSSAQSSEPKSLDVALNIEGVEKICSKTFDCGQPGVHSI